MNKVETEFWNLGFNASKSRRYYSKRREFFERLVSLTEVGTAASGTVAFLALLNSYPVIAAWLTGAISILGVTNLVIRFGDRAKSSDSLYREYAELVVVISDADHNDEAALKSSTTRKEKIAVNEKHCLGVIEADAYNEEVVARNINLKHQRHIRWYQKPFGSFFTIWPDRFDLRGD